MHQRPQCETSNNNNARRKLRQYSSSYKCRKEYCVRNLSVHKLTTVVDRWDLIQIKSFWSVNWMKRQLTEWEKIFARCTSEKGLISILYKGLKNKYSRKQMTQLKLTIDLYRVFKEEIKMALKYLKRFSTSLVMREMHIKTTLWFHLITFQMPNISTKEPTTNAGENEWKMKHSFSVKNSQEAKN